MIVTPKQFLEDNTIVIESELSQGPEVPEVMDFWPEVDFEVIEAIINTDQENEKEKVVIKEENQNEDHEEL